MSEINKRVDEVISKYIRPLTYPVAIKICKKGDPVPEKAKVPMKDMKHPIAICQGISLARKYGWTVAMYKEDHACPVAHVILGYVEEPDFIKNGSIIKPLYVDNDEAAVKTQASTPKMPTADTHCIVMAPIHLATFDPDVVIVYGNPAQITRMVQGACYKVGGYVESRFAGRGACGGEITVPYAQNKCNVICPGGGERIFGLTADDEMAFAFPASWIDNVLEGIEKTHKGGVARIPTPQAGLLIHPIMPPYYHELGVYCGIEDE
jgi:uncharacterized protein (DUF169 family)